ncbi:MULTISPECIES: Wzz/FepE/Etk N-terminal domain-containing protein [unclassified Nocardiopsis]|uniref:Wzz/FepE/Etk N-terminal domain-containing protein n=1 Tax=unclassified Nocardiopsis TaxID=2649073 RepID=UPI00093D0AF2|nr:Wzz/FepE/Etk N-terminal domain-containing protein [Nocardiopsis sp. TSRI0078]
MDTDTPGPSGPELREYTALLRRRRRLVGAGVLGGLALATAAVFGLPSTYTSVAAVQVQPSGMAEFTGERSGRLSGDVNLDTEAQVLVSDQVSSVVAEELSGEGPAPTTEELREHVDVSVPPNSNVLEISYSAPSPEEARAGAQAYADAYLDMRRARVEDLVDGHLEALRGEQENRYEALAEAASEDASSPGASARAEALRQEITELGGEIGPLSALRETVRAGRVITPAGLPEHAGSPVPVLWLVGGTALGLVAGLLAAVVRDRLDPCLHDAEETARTSALPVLLDLSARAGRGDRSPGLLDDGSAPGQRVNEFAHLVRARLCTVPAARGGPAAPDGAGEPAAQAGPPGGAEEESAPGRVLLVAATTPGRAGAAAAVNLAAALARTGSETLLVCADPRTDTVGELLGLPEGPGLAEALLEGEDPAGLEVRPDPVPRLRVLRYGAPGLNAPVQGTAMPELVRLLRADAEYVVVTAAPANERADVHALAGTADVLLPVVELDRTRRADLAGLLTLAGRFGVPVPGTAVLPRQPLAGPAPVTVSEDASTDSDREEPSGAGEGREHPGTSEPAEAKRASGAAKDGRASVAVETEEPSETTEAERASVAVEVEGAPGPDEGTGTAEGTDGTDEADGADGADGADEREEPASADAVSGARN